MHTVIYGPPGTEKSLTAALLGKIVNKEVFRVDLSLIVSKYIGETEKNSGPVLDQTEGKGWILFFDEADALFGKRTGVKDSHDRYANQEVYFLLQRIEDYNGLVILASNKKDNIDEAFSRRFQTMIHFAMPTKAEQIQLWNNAIPKLYPIDGDVNLSHIASEYNLSGGSIMNIVQHATLLTINDGLEKIPLAHLKSGITKEYAKERISL